MLPCRLSSTNRRVMSLRCVSSVCLFLNHLQRSSTILTVTLRTLLCLPSCTTAHDLIMYNHFIFYLFQLTRMDFLNLILCLNFKTNQVCIPNGLSQPFLRNNFSMMVLTGAKGSAVNQSQISCFLGQQALEGKQGECSARHVFLSVALCESSVAICVFVSVCV